MKTISVIALDSRASKFYAKQIKKLFGDYVNVYNYNVLEMTVVNMIRSDLYVITPDAFNNRNEIPNYIPLEAEISQLYVTFTWESIRTLQQIPSGTTAYFVNLTEKMVREATTTLNQLGINHINFIPFYPGSIPNKEITIAITPDEERYVPKHIKNIINLGQRSCTSNTMIEIALKLGLEHLLEHDNFKSYFSKIAASTFNFDLMITKTRKLESRFNILTEILDVGIIGINEKLEIFSANKNSEIITGLPKKFLLGKRCSELLPNIPFSECIKTKKKLEAKVIKINKENINIDIIPVIREEECIGAFAILQKFNDAENRQNKLRTQLIKTGYQAKYTFQDIIGESESITKIKKMLMKMSKKELPILLIGETGTGKELFAHAIHNASNRKDGPFLAINCAAMPDNLLESELFGYEEGAFTGAKKGGKIGLFEFAHNGTLFLDEVECMSTSLQVKLLRVLQEHEIMKIGGNKIININVRIIAATNEPLENKIKSGTFRKDLYYRLNTLPVLIPPLRDRDNDIFLLIENFKKKINARFIFSEEVKFILKNYSWEGNIRELYNWIEYFNFTENSLIKQEDLPPTYNFNQTLNKKSKKFISTNENFKNIYEIFKNKNIIKEEYMAVLTLLHVAFKNNENYGRETILHNLKTNNINLSQKELRTILSILSDFQLIKISKGRGGSKITKNGINYLENL
ncbi:MAG: sigma 54-interacting transcriptional regulator [Fusobacterium sp. JB021]|nr:sigma 54-interacting transcriptional regulator [Fusobacterium sp. JB021]MDP0506245.1 sigma 54-interacting transcriptional regulator [Fusobacterium sp. JB019]